MDRLLGLVAGSPWSGAPAVGCYLAVPIAGEAPTSSGTLIGSGFNGFDNKGEQLGIAALLAAVPSGSCVCVVSRKRRTLERLCEALALAQEGRIDEIERPTASGATWKECVRLVSERGLTVEVALEEDAGQAADFDILDRMVATAVGSLPRFPPVVFPERSFRPDLKKVR